jgi:hypothetical protein
MSTQTKILILLIGIPVTIIVGILFSKWFLTGSIFQKKSDYLKQKAQRKERHADSE